MLKTQKKLAFDLMFEHYYDEACQHIYRLIPNKPATEDVAQEMFVELWRKRDQLNIKISIGAYLRKMAVTRALNYIRDNKKHRHEDDEVLAGQPLSDPSATEILEGQEMSKFITDVIDSLPQRCRQVFMLSRFEQLKYKEIAAELDISVKTVENQMLKALRILRENVANYQNIDRG